MHVLVCDDDNATRFAVKRMLTQHLPCTISECADGVQALQLIGREKFAFILLDVEMPAMSGIEVLELLRESPVDQGSPGHRALERARRPGGAAPAQAGRVGLRPEAGARREAGPEDPAPGQHPAEEEAGAASRGCRACRRTRPGLVVDGNGDFRFVFAGQLQRYGAVLECDSGAAALAAFRESPVNIVFIGRELGVVGAELLVRKLREARGSEGLRLVGLADEHADASFHGLFDAVVPRTFDTQQLHEALRPFVVVPGPMTALSIVVPDLAGAGARRRRSGVRDDARRRRRHHRAAVHGGGRGLGARGPDARRPLRHPPRRAHGRGGRDGRRDAAQWRRPLEGDRRGPRVGGGRGEQPADGAAARQLLRTVAQERGVDAGAGRRRARCRRRWTARGCSSASRFPARASSSSLSWRATRPRPNRRLPPRPRPRGEAPAAAAPQATAV